MQFHMKFRDSASFHGFRFKSAIPRLFRDRGKSLALLMTHFLLQENLMKPFYHKDMIPSELNLQLQNIAGPKSHGECIWHHEQPIFFSREDHARTIEGNKDCACDMHTAQYATERDFKYFFRLMLTSQNSWRLQQL